MFNPISDMDVSNYDFLANPRDVGDVVVCVTDFVEVGMSVISMLWSSSESQVRTDMHRQPYTLERHLESFDIRWTV